MPHTPLPSSPQPDLEVRLANPADGQVRARVRRPGVMTVGKLSTANLVLPATDSKASRLHFQIDLDSAYCRLTSHSEQGTFVNGLLVSTQCDLRHGDLIRASQSVFVAQV